MARPKKQIVDYFPHYCQHKKTMFMLEQKYQNDGYAFWFKLLELLGSSEGHFINCNDVTTWSFLCARSMVSEEKAEEILSFLACIGAIDGDLWQRKYVWCQNFVDGLGDLYARRKVDLPVKESIFALESDVEKDEELELKIWCRNATNKAILAGKLIKQPCEVCGSTTNIEAHHTDYTNPFEVNWLCKTHHVLQHKTENGELITPQNPLTGINVDINPQSKVKESKGKESKVKESNNIPFSEIVDYLNEKAGTKYRPNGEKTKNLIKARWNDGFTLDDFKKVIDNKCAEWLGSESMAQYLRPETLFGTKFESYLNQKAVKKGENGNGGSETSRTARKDPNAGYAGPEYDYQGSYDKL